MLLIQNLTMPTHIYPNPTASIPNLTPLNFSLRSLILRIYLQLLWSNMYGYRTSGFNSLISKRIVYYYGFL